jgi:chloride channel 7
MVRAAGLASSLPPDLAVLAYGIAVPAGLFIPSLLSGAAMGRLAGVALNAALARAGALTGGAQVSVGVYSLLGAAAVLGGNTRMVISLAVLVIECTGNYQFALPLMVVLFAARFVGDLFNEGIYDLHIALRKVPILRDAVPRRFAYALRARDVMARVPGVAVLREVEEAGRVLEALERGCGGGGGAAQTAFPVVFCEGEGEGEGRRGDFAGLIGRRELAFLLSLRALHSERPRGSML